MLRRALVYGIVDVEIKGRIIERLKISCTMNLLPAIPKCEKLKGQMAFIHPFNDLSSTRQSIEPPLPGHRSKVKSLASGMRERIIQPVFVSRTSQNSENATTPKMRNNLPSGLDGMGPRCHSLICRIERQPCSRNIP